MSKGILYKFNFKINLEPFLGWFVFLALVWLIKIKYGTKSGTTSIINRKIGLVSKKNEQRAFNTPMKTKAGLWRVCKNAKLQRHEKGCENLTTRASRIKSPFLPWIRFLFLWPPHFMCGLEFKC